VRLVLIFIESEQTMNANFIESNIRRTNLKLLGISLFGLLLVFAGLVLGTRYLYNMVLGPFSIENSDLLIMQDRDKPWQYYVTVIGEDHANTGYYYASVSDSGKETIEDYYHVLMIGDRLLLVKSKDEEITNQVSGALESISSEVQREVIDQLEREIPEITGAFLPVMLDATNFRSIGFIWLAIGTAVGLIATGGVLLAMYRFINPLAHPAMRALERFGQVESISRQIDMDMSSPHKQLGKKIHLTSHWLVYAGGAIQAMPYTAIMWGYKQVTQHRTNGIPTGKTYAAYVFDQYGKQLTIPGKEAQVNEFLQELANLAPGMVLGYSDELKQLWNKERSRFIQAVEERRNRPEVTAD